MYGFIPLSRVRCPGGVWRVLRCTRAMTARAAQKNRVSCCTRPGGPESSLFGSGLRASGRGLTLEVLRWHGVDMYIEQLTHEDFTQTTRSAPVTAATTWTLLHQSMPCTGAVRKHTLRCMSRYSRALATVPR